MFETWPKQHSNYDPNQLEFKFFWPLTEQMELDLEYGPTHLHYSARGVAGVSSMPIAGSIYEFTNVGTVSGATTINSVSLEVEPTNAVGSLKIGSINIGLQKKPNIAQRVLHRLLGFSWKDK